MTVIESGVAEDNVQPIIPLEPLPIIREELQEALDIPSNEENQQYPTGFKFNILLLAIGMSMILVGLDFNIIAVALPTITTHFHTISDVGWYYSAYRLTSCSFQFLFGKLYHQFSVKHVFLTSIAIFEVGSLLAGSSPTSKVLVLGRAISGLGCAGIVSGTIVTQSFPLSRRPFVGGIAAAIEGVASASSPVLGGILTEYVSWRYCFYLNLPFGGLAFVLIHLFFQDPQINRNERLLFGDKMRQLDLLGTAFFIPSIICLILALQWGGSTYGWGNARISVLFVLSAVLISAFVLQERRKGDNALLPGRIVWRRSLLAGMWFSFCNNSALAVFEYYMPTYFQVVRGVSASKSGILSLPLIGGFLISILVGGSATSLMGYYTPLMMITSTLTPIAAGLLTTLQIKQSMASLISYQILLGVGAGLGFQGPQSAAQTVLSTRDSSIGIAMVIFAQNFGPAIFVSVAQTILTEELQANLASVVSLDASALTSIGFGDLAKYVPAADLMKVIEGYDKALSTVFFLPVGIACASMVGALCMEWISVKRKLS